MKCLVGSGGEGGGLLPAEVLDRFRVELAFSPDAEETPGERRAVFEGDVVSGDPRDGGVSAKGLLAGNFGLDADEELEMAAYAESFTRDGKLAHVMVNVFEDDDPSGRVVFSASLTPERADAASEDVRLRATVFMGRASLRSAN